MTADSPTGKPDPDGPGHVSRQDATASTESLVELPPMPPPNVSIEGYEIVRELHRGGQGVVYEAVQRSTKRKVAIKVLVEGRYASKTARKRFEREIELVAQLKHPNIIAIFDSALTTDGHRFYVMEYVRGVTVKQFVRQNKLAVDTALLLFCSVCKAVQYAHEHGVIHRDLKPSNVLVDSVGMVKVLDFGLAKQLVGPVETLVSVTGEVVGTLPYMSPEQTRGNPDEIDTRTDIYSLGVILYELLTGHYPYPVTGNMVDVLKHVAESPPTPPTRVWTPDTGISGPHGGRLRPKKCPIDDGLERIVLTALAKARDERYQTVRAFSQDLERYLNDVPVVARKPKYMSRRAKGFRRGIAVIATMTVLFLTAAAAVWYREYSQGKAAKIDALIEGGISFVNIAQWERAESEFARALQIDADHVRARLAVLWMRVERLRKHPELGTTEYLEELDYWCRQILEREPDNLTALNYHGIVLKERGRYAHAIRVANRIIALDPNHSAAWSNLGAYYALDGDLARAERCLHKGAELAEEGGRTVDRAEAWRNLAALEVQLQRLEDANAHLRRAIHLKADYVPSRVLRARVRLHGESDEDRNGALKSAELADRLAGGRSARARRMLALASLRNGQFGRAVENAAFALQLGDLPAINHLILSVAEARQGNRQAASEHLTVAREHWPPEFADAEFLAKYDEGILWFESRAELEALRDEAEKIIETTMDDS